MYNMLSIGRASVFVMPCLFVAWLHVGSRVLRAYGLGFGCWELIHSCLICTQGPRRSFESNPGKDCCELLHEHSFYGSGPELGVSFKHHCKIRSESGVFQAEDFAKSCWWSYGTKLLLAGFLLGSCTWRSPPLGDWGVHPASARDEL
jgi:hypothetical protein